MQWGTKHVGDGIPRDKMSWVLMWGSQLIRSITIESEQHCKTIITATTSVTITFQIGIIMCDDGHHHHNHPYHRPHRQHHVHDHELCHRPFYDCACLVC